MSTVTTPVCEGNNALLSATTTTPLVTWLWTGPNSFSSTAQNPSVNNVVLSSAGAYVVKATLAGCSNEDTVTLAVVTTNGGINAQSNSPICTNDTIKLNATGTGAANSYTWSGPNGFNSTSMDTIILNASTLHSGEYRFTANYVGCVFYDTIQVTVVPFASGRAISTNAPVCAGDNLTLNASSTSSNVAYTWTGPGSFVSTSQNTTINNAGTAQSGKYYVLFTVNGCFVKDSINITVNPPPAAFTSSANTPLCAGDTLRLHNTNSSTGVLWNWSGPNSFSSAAKDSFIANSTVSMSGDYIATATNSFGCTKKDTVTVLVNPGPANFSASSNSPICQWGTLNLYGNTSSSGVSYAWTGPNSFTNISQNPTISNTTLAASGNYIVTGTLNGCSSKDTITVIVNPIPATPAATANTPVCVGQNLSLTASNITGAAYQWTSTTGYTSSLQNPVIPNINTSAAGKYYVKATANGCTSGADSVTVVVNPAPNISMYPSPKDSICQGATVTFISNIANAGSSFTRNWYRNNTVIAGISGANYATSSAVDNDEYYVTLTATGVCANPFTDTSNIIKMRVLPWLAPAVSITANPVTTVPSGTMINFTATPVNGGLKPKYQWTRNGANIGGAISDIWGASTLSNGDDICVIMTSNYLCPNPATAKSNCIKVSIETTGIKGIWKHTTPDIYPNPAKDKLIIEGISKGTRIQLIDVLGRTVINQIATQETEVLNTAHLIPGNYILQLSTEQGERMRVKITKE